MDVLDGRDGLGHVLYHLGQHLNHHLHHGSVVILLIGLGLLVHGQGLGLTFLLYGVCLGLTLGLDAYGFLLQTIAHGVGLGVLGQSVLQRLGRSGDRKERCYEKK